MLNKSFLLLLLFIPACLPATLLAETVYIDDRFLVGIHEEKSVDSVISKLLPSGTALDLIKRDEPLSQVRDPEGVIGWVDNQYLATTEPGRAQLAKAESRIDELETELQSAAQGRPPGVLTADAIPEQEQLQKENEELKQLLKSERLRVGELQAQTAELKNRLSGTVKPANSEEQLDKLRAENEALREQLAALQASREEIAVEKPVLQDFSLADFPGEFDRKKMLIAIAVSLLIGIAAGVYLLDLYNRRRHGGFRV